MPCLSGKEPSDRSPVLPVQAAVAVAVAAPAVALVRPLFRHHVSLWQACSSVFKWG